MGPNRASLLDMLAWQVMTGNVLSHWERHAIMALGSAWVGVQVEQQASVTLPPEILAKAGKK